MDDDLKVFNPTILLSNRGPIDNGSGISEPQDTSIDTGDDGEQLLP